ncbi:hypothetical protein [Halalkalibacillus halophilus]|uniref:hypothetical protein n=1 Tax=Halalkalibacillus halophilus TaxID=392827 RepID=UPI000405F154|nr:hypothetical protein [Halalkalibacillus halophilus]
MHSFYDFSYVRTLSPANLNRLLHNAFAKKEERIAWEVWIARFPNMTEENYISFDDFKADAQQQKEVTSEHTGETVKDLYNRFKKEAGGGSKDENNST